MGKIEDASEQVKKFNEAGKPYRFNSETGKAAAYRAQEVIAEKKARKADLHYLGEILGKYLLKPLENGECISIDDVESLKEIEKKNTTAIEKGVQNLAQRFANGDKRAVTQVAEILATVTEAEDREEANGFLEALSGHVEDWAQDEPDE